MKDHTTVYIGMDVHLTSFTLCSLAEGEDSPKNVQAISADYLLVVKYINGLRKRYGEGTDFICGYEAGCLGYSLYRSLKDCGQKCVILAPTTMAIEKSNQRIKLMALSERGEAGHGETEQLRITMTLYCS